VIAHRISPATLFRERCINRGINLDEGQLGLIQGYVALLLEWNKKINLISRKDEEQIWERHIFHCASLLFKFEFPAGSHVVDIGSGGGLPGIPLKILQPDLKITLVDSIRKKVESLQEITARLALKEVDVALGRAEDLGRKADYKKRFDIAVARAVAPLENLVAWSRPLLKDRRGHIDNSHAQSQQRLRISPPALLAMKGGDLVGEISKARRTTKAHKPLVIDLELSHDEGGLNDKKVVYIQFQTPTDKEIKIER
jgi:16S rRNA (guanine527-N7)-methyltransferase